MTRFFKRVARAVLFPPLFVIFAALIGVIVMGGYIASHWTAPAVAIAAPIVKQPEKSIRILHVLSSPCKSTLDAGINKTHTQVYWFCSNFAFYLEDIPQPQSAAQ
jgi:hypothetical protein